MDRFFVCLKNRSVLGIFLLIVFCGLYVSELFSQNGTVNGQAANVTEIKRSVWSWSLKANFGYSSYSGELSNSANVSSDFKSGFAYSVGGYLEYRYNSFLSFESGIEYRNMGCRYESKLGGLLGSVDFTLNTRDRLHYMSVPFFFGFDFLDYSLYAGPVWNISAGGSREYELVPGAISTADTNFKSEINNLESDYMSFRVGFATMLSDHWGLTSEVDISVTNIFIINTSSINSINMFSVAVLYRF